MKTFTNFTPFYIKKKNYINITAHFIFSILVRGEVTNILVSLSMKSAHVYNAYI